MTDPRQIGIGIREAVETVAGNPRSLTAQTIAVSLGIGLYVVVAMLSAAAEQQVASDFDALRATEVTLRSATSIEPWLWLPEDYRFRLEQIPSITNIEKLGEYQDVVIAATPPTAAGLGQRLSARLMGVDPGGPAALGATIVGRRLPSPERFASQTCLIGARVAAALGISEVDGRRAVWINDTPCLIAGIVTEAGRRSPALDSVIVSHDFAEQVVGLPNAVELLLEVAPGAGAAVAAQAPLALAPHDPSSVTAIAPPDPDLFRQRLEGNVRSTLFLIGGIAVVIGILTIGNSAAAGVVARRSEIGLRRALGGTRRSIFAQFITESALAGFAGGAIGASLGILAALAAARSRGWAPVFDVLVPAVGAGTGIGIGVIAGLVPAIRASRLQPAEALRSQP